MRSSTRSLRLVKPASLRPQPPELPPNWTAPAPELASWAIEHFVLSSGRFFVEEHSHLEHLSLGFLWSSAPNARKRKTVLATASIPQAPPTGDAWTRARYRQQLAEWFPDGEPDFIITVWTGCAELADIRFCQLLHHELRHCGQAEDEFGCPRFNRETGRPIPAILGHDWEGFASEVALFGVHDSSLREVVDAASRAPRFEAEDVAGICGTCGRLAA